MSRGARGIRLNPSHDDRARAKIKTSQIINRLNAFVLRDCDPVSGQVVVMTRDEITAALGLLRKTLPDLTSVAGTLVHTHRRAVEMTDDELADIVAGRRAGDPQTEDGASGPDSVH